METLVGVVCLFLGGAVGFLVAKQRRHDFLGLSERNEQLQIRIIELERTAAVLGAEKDALTQQLETKNDEVVNLGNTMCMQFEGLANKVLMQNSNQFKLASEQNLLTLLNPLKERMVEFQKKVEDVYSNEARERFALTSEIQKIVEANQKITLETGNLTRALRGDVKAQGNWGELILERVLEASGLREGEEFVLQGKDLKLTDAEGKKQRPDVILNLPDKKHLVVDSKVSLVHYERYISAVDEIAKEESLQNYIGSLYNHIAGLSSKQYQHSEKLESPDFVMMFLPSEGAFSLAMQTDGELFKYAWERTIILVSPTTLLATLRTVASVWKQERQTKNALEIAKQGGALYDKFVGFVSDMEAIGQTIKRTHETYDGAMSKLKDGKGNIIARIEGLRRLGAKATKEIPGSLLTEQLDELETIS